MHDYLFSSEIVRFAFLFGIVTSMLLYERLHLTTGSIVVPGYIAMMLDDPMRVAVTIALSLLTWGAVRMLSEVLILFGRRRFAVFIIVSFLLRYLSGLVTAEAHLPVNAALVIGYLVPGILAHEIDRQGAVKTLSSMLVVAVALKLVVLALAKSAHW